MRAYTLTVSGSTILSGSLDSNAPVTASYFRGDGSAITGVTAEWDGTHTGDGVITGDFTVDTNTVFVDASENTVGIGTSSPGSPLHIKGSCIPKLPIVAPCKLRKSKF